jgi:hypothetical protein
MSMICISCGKVHSDNERDCRQCISTRGTLVSSDRYYELRALENRGSEDAMSARLWQMNRESEETGHS